MSGPEPTRIRAQAGAERTVVRIAMTHEMESGQRKDAGGRLVPAWHIREAQVSLNGRRVLELQLGPSVAKNPFVQFALRGAKAGDRIAVGWTDSRGQRRSDETLVVAG